MEYVYVLQSGKDGNFYTGWTNDLRKRFSEHQNGKVYSTKRRLPMKLVYYEACIDRKDALKREKYFKTAWSFAQKLPGCGNYHLVSFAEEEIEWL